MVQEVKQLNNEWWRGAVIYQVYPRSFKDSTGSGTGDINGVIEKLPYLKQLNIDAIWLSPFFTSPMKDFGYDVSDYRDVDPTFGTLSDFKALIKQAHALGIKIVIDQVLSHTSDQHPWFIESKQNRDNDKSDWYVWAEPKADGTVPNNWLSFFGGSAWTFDAKRKQYYLHNFLSSQPDLNYHNPDVQDAVLDVLRFWLDLGVDGFRLDTVNMYFCDAALRDNPPRDPELPIQGMNSANPRAWQEQLYNVNRPENAEFLERIRCLMDEYDNRTTLGEIGSVQDTIGMMANYTSGNNRLHMCYTADLLSEQNSAEFVQQVIQSTEARISDGWPCWSLGNHDAVRFATRWGAKVADKLAFNKAMLTLLFSLRGSVCLYQGEELGLEDVELEFDQLVDPFGIAFWPDYKGRDGCRTPMVWHNEANGGFSSAEKTWLPISPQHLDLSADTQSQDAESLLSYVQQFLSFRAEQKALITGDITLKPWAKNVIAMERTLNSDRCLVLINMSDERVELQDADFSNVTECLWGNEVVVTSRQLQPWQTFIAKLK